MYLEYFHKCLTGSVQLFIDTNILLCCPKYPFFSSWMEIKDLGREKREKTPNTCKEVICIAVAEQSGSRMAPVGWVSPGQQPNAYSAAHCPHCRGMAGENRLRLRKLWGRDKDRLLINCCCGQFIASSIDLGSEIWKTLKQQLSCRFSQVQLHFFAPAISSLPCPGWHGWCWCLWSVRSSFSSPLLPPHTFPLL